MLTSWVLGGNAAERKWYYSSKLCTTNIKEYFPFPLSLEPKSWNVKAGEYVVPDDIMSSMYTEMKVRRAVKGSLVRRVASEGLAPASFRALLGGGESRMPVCERAPVCLT